MSEASPPSYPPDSSQGIAPPPGVRRTIAVGGGRGGVGKSVLAANLGVYVAQLGRSVLLIDADPAGAALHTVLGIDLPNIAAPSSEDDEEEALVALPTQVPGLQLVPQGYRIGSPVPVRPGRKPRRCGLAFRNRHSQRGQGRMRRHRRRLRPLPTTIRAS